MTFFTLPEEPVDAVKSQSSAQSLEATGMKRQAVDPLKQRLHVGGTFLLLLDCGLFYRPFHKLLNAATTEISQSAVHRIHHTILKETHLIVIKIQTVHLLFIVIFTKIDSKTATVSWLSNFLLFVNQ